MLNYQGVGSNRLPPRFKTKVMNLICPICGIEFEKTGRRQIYCSRQCSRKSDKSKNWSIKYSKLESTKESKRNRQKTDKYREYQRKKSKEDKRKEWNKKYRQTEKYKEYMKKMKQSDKCKEYEKKRHKYQMENLCDCYVLKTLLMTDAPKELIELKREQLKLHRLIKQMS